MKFINAPVAIIFLLGVLLSACSSGPEKPEPKTEQPLAEGAVARSPLLPEGPVTPNPYLADKPSVNRQNRQLFTDAQAAMNNKQWPQAEKLLLQLTAQAPTLSGAFLNLGMVYQAQENFEKAEAAFNQAITANKNNLDAYNQFAIFKRERGDFVAAESLYKQALVVWPFHPVSHKNIGILYDLYMGKPEQAVQHYQAYQQLLSEPDKEVNGWIVDLERRLGAAKGG